MATDHLARATGQRTPVTGPTLAELDARRARLDVLADRCNEAAADRPADIRENHASLGLPDRFPDLQTYLYQPLDERHPALATLAELGDLVATVRQRVERRMYA